MSPAQLIDQFGEPSEKLSDSIWVYSDFRAKGRPVGEECDTLVVVFHPRSGQFASVNRWFLDESGDRESSRQREQADAGREK
jgi:hypothetical protein